MLTQIEHFDRRSAASAPLRAAMRKISGAELDRRGILKGVAGFALALQVLPGEAAAFEAYPTQGENMPNGIVRDPHVFISIAPDGQVTIVAHRSEMGTGIRTTLPMIIADEMEADWDRVTVVQAPGDEPTYGNQDTDGSRSLRHHIQPAREMGAAVRRMLELAAADRWGVPVDEVRAEEHRITHASLGYALDYGELAEAAMALDPPPRDDLRFKEDAEFRYMGKGQVQIVDLHDITTGKAVYGADVRLPDMRYAVIARPPVVGATITALDTADALALDGVEQVVEIPIAPMGSKFRPLGGVAVIATSTWAAIQGRDLLAIEWDRGPHGSFNTEAYEQELRNSAANPGTPVRNQGDAEGALAGAARVLTYEYYQKHMAHAPMEPPAAVARFADGQLEIWAPVQSPYVARTDTAEYLGMDPADVTLNVTLLGGAFGRKSKADFATEAAFLAKETGRPVKVQWTREDDIRHSYYHTTSVDRIEVGLDAQDQVVAWRHRAAQPSFISTFVPEDPGVQHAVEIGMGLENLPYDLPNIAAEYCPAIAHTRIGWFRAVSNIPRAFAVQSATAELAAELGIDQKDFLLQMIGAPRILDQASSGLPEGKFWNQFEPYEEFPFDTGRLANVLNLAADKAGWGRDLPAGEGIGLAVHRSFVSYVAMAVRARVADGTVYVPEVHVAVDAGFVANPERVMSQMQGACVMGMTAALHTGVDFVDGEAVQSNFADYQMVRSDNYPEVVHTHIVDHPFAVHATGVGEPGMPPFLPALTNAIFNATGTRIRNLPIADQLA